MGNLIQRLLRRNQKQKMFDSVTDQIKNQTHGGLKVNPETGVRYEEPLEEKHPGLTIGLMAAQPGTILEKVLAPMVYKGMAQSVSEGNLSEALIYGLVPKTGQWEEITKHTAEWAAGHPERYSMLKAEGKGVTLPKTIASNKKNLVEKGITEYGDPYVIRRNEVATNGIGDLGKNFRGFDIGSKDTPADWALSGYGSHTVRRHKQGGKLKRK